MFASPSAKDLARLYGQNPDEASEARHPVARIHEETGDKALYVCAAFTQHFEDWSRAESRALLGYLYEHSVRPEFQARHQWRQGDLVMWDNRCTQHARRNFPGNERRLLRRIGLEGDVPY